MREPAPIRVLPDAVINQIAAGEVVERPASVLKELVENAIDAGAARIEVDVVDGGRRLVRVRDDGTGMDRDNALLAIERHATSKLRDLQDLDSIATLGFRGEALAAIASVSQFTLVTNRAGAAAGTEILIFGGKIQEVRDAGAPPGTDIAVRNLFFNVPARRKFLRSAPTEFTHVRQAFLLEALAHPGLAFVLRADDADVYRLPAAASLLDRIRDLYGPEVTEHLRPLRFGNGVVDIGGHAGRPPFSRLDRELQVVFINGRPSGSPVVNFAIQSAYRSVLPGGRYAPLFLHVNLPADLVDVNVHPAKKEVRFRRPTEVRDVIIEALRLAISGTELPPGKTDDSAREAGRRPVSLPSATGPVPPPARVSSADPAPAVPVPMAFT
jgi:DNA mismatch repair protein MutL